MGNSGLSWGKLLMGVLFIVTALISFRNPFANLLLLALMFGFIAVSNGIWLILNRQNSFFRFIIGVLDILIGVVFLFNLGLSTAMMPFIFAFWFIINSFANLLYSKQAKNISIGFYWFNLIVSILCILLGVALLFDPIASTMTITFLVGFYFMIMGIEYIVEAFQG